MMVKTNAIVLKTNPYADRKMVVEMFTADYGYQSFAVTVPATKRGKLKRQYFIPLSRLEIAYDMRPNRRLQLLTDVRFSTMATYMYEDAVKLPVALFVVELLTIVARHEHENRQLFEFVDASIDVLELDGEHTANFHLVFMTMLTRLVGIAPDEETYAAGSWLDLREGCFTLLRPAHQDVAQPEVARRIALFLRGGFEGVAMPMNREERNCCLDALMDYYRLHLPSFPELKSVAILRQLFQ